MTQTIRGRPSARSVSMIALLCVLAAAIPTTAATRDSLLHQYVGAVLSQNWPLAESLWLPAEVAQSQRLGIQFEGIPAKYDCASPLVQFRDAIRSGAATVQVNDSATSTCQPMVAFAVSAQGITARTSYSMIEVGDDWRLASPVFACTQNWATRETRFARLHFRDSSLVNEYALAQLDRFVDSVLRLLLVPVERVRQLESVKIDYYLGDSADVRLLTGFDTQGMTYLPLDAVITQCLPHYHELVHVLVNFALAHVPLYTIPWMQEGLAVCMGGRWGKSPVVLMQLGAYVVGSGMAEFADVLTYKGFHEGVAGLDVSYALSGLLMRHLLDRVGTARLLTLYRDLSGSNAQVQSFTLQEVQQRIDTLLQQPWDSTVQRCTEELKRYQYSGLRPVKSAPSGDLFYKAEASSIVGRIWSDDSSYTCEIHADSLPVAGAFLFRERDGSRLGKYRSRLFARQLDGQQYSGEILGIVFDDQEAGLYDYRTDNLLAKFAVGFSSGEQIWDAGERVIRFRLLKSVSPVDVSEYSCRMIRRSGPVTHRGR